MGDFTWLGKTWRAFHSEIEVLVQIAKPTDITWNTTPLQEAHPCYDLQRGFDHNKKAADWLLWDLYGVSDRD